jgi:hypothetical protein
MKNYSVIDAVDTLGNDIRELVLTFDFVDGDGNISDSEDRVLVTIPPDTVEVDTTTYSKIFLKLYEKKQGIYYAIADSALLTPTTFLIPYGDAMSREGQNKTQKGEMAVNYSFYYSSGNKLPFDTLQIDLYIRDRAWEKSNVIRISDIALKK